MFHPKKQNQQTKKITNLEKIEFRKMVFIKWKNTRYCTNNDKN
jgi:hypothetical protein